jgi:Flp pilus assembly protein TadG
MRAWRILRSVWQQEFGQGLVLGTLAMVAILGFTAMAIDAGIFLHERRDLQKAADAAALAGAAELPESPAEAEAKVHEWADKNGIDIAGGELELVEVTTTYVTNDTVRVRVTRETPFVFGRALGLTSETMHATGVGRVGSPTIATNAMPWALRESYREAAEAAGYGQPVVLMESAHGGASGAFGGLCFGGHCGASDYRDAIEDGVEVDLGQPHEMAPGVMPGPTGQGMDYRLTNTDENCRVFEEVFRQIGLNEWEFISNDCNPWTDEGSGSLRVVLAPVIEDHYYDDCGGASCMVEAGAFAMLFLEDPSMCVTPEHPEEPLVCARFLRASFDVGFLIGQYDPDTDIRFVRLVE